MLIAAIMALALAGAGDASPSVEKALELARRRFPSTTWRASQARVGDFTFDGTPDVALLGVEKQGVVVLVIEGPVKDGSRMLSLRLPAQPDSQGGICGAPEDTRIELERPGLQDCARGDADCEPLAKFLDAMAAKGGKGIALDNSEYECDPFHIIYDGKRLAWSRL